MGSGSSIFFSRPLSFSLSFYFILVAILRKRGTCPLPPPPQKLRHWFRSKSRIGVTRFPFHHRWPMKAWVHCKSSVTHAIIENAWVHRQKHKWFMITTKRGESRENLRKRNEKWGNNVRIQYHSKGLSDSSQLVFSAPSHCINHGPTFCW